MQAAGHLRLAKFVLVCVALLIGISGAAAAQEGGCEIPAGICAHGDADHFALISAGRPARIEIDDPDWAGVHRAADAVQRDLAGLAGAAGAVTYADNIIIAGTLGRSPRIDALVAAGKVDASAISGVWEAYLQVVVDDPEPGIARALIIAGADKRGTIYGLYDLAERAGASPWAWWADVPLPLRPELHVAPGMATDWPRVKYRGIFINDEKPALHGWANKNFGGFTSPFYERVFELILRHKGNYLWPAMWGEAAYDDDPLTGPLADEMGIVMGTSHHEPLGRAHVEWTRHGSGSWDYSANTTTLQAFWRGGMERMANWETIVTLGMRGDGDEAMAEGTAIDLLERIVSDQRKIISDVTGKPASERPSIWALYKEVQDYYDQGMQVPDDVTLLFSDDNWGNIRRLPKLNAARRGGYGIYYHFDYVGGPRNYKWLNTNQIERVWEQMRLAWDFGAREVWIANVGDIKPMELPISFFMDLAWNPEAMSLEVMAGYYETWAAQQFPAAHAAEIGELLSLYTKYAARRKHELVDPETFSVVNFDEYYRVTAEWTSLAARAEALRGAMSPAYDDAFVQLVWLPIVASANLYELYEAAAFNRLYAAQGRALEAVELAARAEALFDRDAELTRIFHEDVADGKWMHMMSQTHIGYTSWQQPEMQVMPELSRPEILDDSELGIAIEGEVQGRHMNEESAALPLSHVFQSSPRWIELFPRGGKPVSATVVAREDWIIVPGGKRSVAGTDRVEIAIDWDKAPTGHHVGRLTVKTGLWQGFDISVPIFKPEGWAQVRGYPLVDHVAIDAANASRVVSAGGVDWMHIPNLGRTSGGMTLTPVTAQPASPPGGDSAHLEFDLHLFERGPLTVEIELAPTLDFKGDGGLKFALSLNDGAPVIANVHEQLTQSDWSEAHWETVVARNAHRVSVVLPVDGVGAQTLKLWAIDPALIYQKVTISQQPPPASYLGPPETTPR